MSHYQRIVAAAKYPDNLPNHPLSLSQRKSRLQPHLTNTPGRAAMLQSELVGVICQFSGLSRSGEVTEPDHRGEGRHLVTIPDSSVLAMCWSLKKLILRISLLMLLSIEKGYSWLNILVTHYAYLLTEATVHIPRSRRG